jgi:PAS domain S-box-containing protein
VSSTPGLASALEDVLAEFNGHVGTRRTSVWLYHRRARELYLFASSDADYRRRAHRIPAADSSQPAARGLRLDQPLIFQETPAAVLIAPLRGWRRALGTVVVEGTVSDELTNRERLDLAGDLARQLSSGIENVQLLEEMLRQRRLLEDTFNSLVDLVVVTDREHRVVQMNDAFAMRVGRPRPELLERPLDELVGRELAEWATLSDGDLSAERVRAREHHAFGGSFVVTMTPLIDEDGEQVGTVLVARDVTEQARLEAERETLRARLAQSEKLASLGQFVAGIAHEINNPLQGVLGYIELLLVAPAHQGTAAQKNRHLRGELRRIYREADRAAKIVQNLLTFSGSQRKIRRRLRLERVISRALVSRRRALARAQIEVVRDQKDDLATVIGDPMLLQQALLNVIINAEHAVAATNAPGTIVISTMARGGRVVMTVRDSGTGVNEDILPRIFDPFFTTKTVGQGTGLGLAITYGIVQEHGGVIHAANVEDGGALFTIDLPEAAPA